MKKLIDVDVNVLIWAHLRDHACRDGIKDDDEKLIQTPNLASNAENERRCALLNRHRHAELDAIKDAAPRGCAVVQIESDELLEARCAWGGTFRQAAEAYAELEHGAEEVRVGRVTKSQADLETVQKLRVLYSSTCPPPLLSEKQWPSDPASEFDLYRTIWLIDSDHYVLDGTHRLIALAGLIIEKNDVLELHAFAVGRLV